MIRVETAPNHLSVIELAEAVTKVAAGSSSYKIEWRGHKVFVQPLDPEATTNLFIWTASGRLSYELVPAPSVEEMHFAIDQEPRPPLPNYRSRCVRPRSRLHDLEQIWDPHCMLEIRSIREIDRPPLAD